MKDFEEGTLREKNKPFMVDKHFQKLTLTERIRQFYRKFIFFVTIILKKVLLNFTKAPKFNLESNKWKSIKLYQKLSKNLLIVNYFSKSKILLK